MLPSYLENLYNKFKLTYEKRMQKAHRNINFLLFHRRRGRLLPPQRTISTTLISSLPNGAKMYKLQNNLRLHDYPHLAECEARKEQYAKDSLETLKSLLNPNCYYMVVDKAVKLPENEMYPGHIFSFFTNPHSLVEEKSCVSLRAGARIPGLELKYSRKELGDNRIRSCGVSKVEFENSVDNELIKYFFKKAIEDRPLGIRFLNEIHNCHIIL